MEFFEKLFDSDFMPHGHCYFWRPEILWPHALGDLFSALAYFVIPVFLYRYVKNRPELRQPGVILAFSLFILSCGISHLLAVVSVWNPVYRAEAVSKVTTAVVSWGTIGLLIRLYRPSLAIPTPAQLQKAIADLRRENEQRIKTEQQLRISEQSFRASMNYAPSGIAQIDPNEKWLHVNAALCRILGYTKQGLVERNLTAYFHPDDQVKYREAIQQLINGEEEGLFMEVRCLHRDGHIKWTMMGIAPVFDDNGQLMHFVLQLMDVTTQKQQQKETMDLNTSLEAKVRERTAQLQEANQELESFSYSVSHDLKAPVKNIEGLTLILEGHYASQFNEQGTELIRHIKNSAQKMNRLITAYLDFSKIGQQHIQKERFDIEQQFHETFREMSTGYGDRPVEFSVGTLPPALGDAELMRQVVRNLVSNALKYSSKKAAIEIEVKGTLEGDSAVYQIKDNGTGFDPASKEKLFRMFQRLHAGSEYSGHGIGLAFSHRIVKKHGGHMWAESEPDQGATFYFSLPEK